MEVVLSVGEKKKIDNILDKFDNLFNRKDVFTRSQVYRAFNEFKRIHSPELDFLYTSEEKKKRLTGYRRFQLFVRYLMSRNLCNFDTMILLTGVKGAGKSSTGIQLIRVWCKLLGINFNPKRHIAYNNADMLDRIENLSFFEPLLADEAIRFATSEDWNKAENKALKKKLGEVRTKHLFYVLCFPLEPSKLEKTYLNSYVNYWVDIYARGKGTLFVKDMNPGKDAWSLKYFEKLGSWNEFSDDALIEKKLKEHPNFWQFIRIPKVPKKVEEKYLEVREHNVYEDENVMKAMSKEDAYKALLILTLKDIMTRDGSLSLNRILKSIENQHGIQMRKQDLSFIIKDSEDFIKLYKAQVV